MANKAANRSLCVLLLAMALVLGIAAGFIVGYLVKDLDCNGTDTGETNEDVLFIHNHAPGPCKLVKGIDVGSEDMTLLPSGLVIITAGLTSYLPRDRPDLLNRTGSLMLFDFNDPDRGAAYIPIVNEDAFDYPHFNPNGMSIWIDESGRISVFVVNHNYVPDQIETIEEFEFDETTRQLTHIRTIEDESMVFMNNLIATGPNTFYFTNFMSSRDPEVIDQQLRDRIEAGNIGYYDGARGHILVEGLKSPNGISISPDGHYVYMAEFGRELFQTYTRHRDNNLSLYKSYNVHTQPDNINADGDYVWTGCKPHRLTLMDHVSDPITGQTASQVLRLKVENGELTEKLEVYADDGEQFSGLAGALYFEEKLLMGSTFTKALFCEVKYIG